VDNLQSALNINDLQPATKPIHRGFIIGGASIINDTLNLVSASSSLVDRVLLTRILSPKFECDTFIPDFLASGQWSRSSYADLKSWVGCDVPEGIQTENDIEYEFQMWTRD
jgi:dihydrofolate reductase